MKKNYNNNATPRTEQTVTVKEAFEMMLKSFQMEEKYKQQRVLNNWEEIVGKVVSSKTTKLYFKDKKLFVYVTSAPLKKELQMSKALVMANIFTFAGDAIVEDVVIL
jgi:predicted nucleic acid-binding Zn ribbon protein